MPMAACQRRYLHPPNLLITHELDTCGKAAEWLSVMKEEGVAPTVISCNAVIAAYVQAAQPVVAASWLEKMREMGVQPNVVSYSTVIDGFAKKLKPDEAPRDTPAPTLTWIRTVRRRVGWRRCRRPV